jgi:hypothetical protein
LMKKTWNTSIVCARKSMCLTRSRMFVQYFDKLGWRMFRNRTPRQNVSFWWNRDDRDP